MLSSPDPQPAPTAMVQSNSVKQRDDYDTFISYSRRDKEFVSRLCEALIQAKLKIWVDWNDIPPAEDWRQEIYRGIEASNNFVFIISSHSIASKVCGEELSYAIKHGKRLVPIVREDVGYDNVHPELGRINWIFFREGDDFDSGLKKLISAIETDMSHVREQTHLLVRARKWEKAERNKSYLLQASELRKAEQWLAETLQAMSLHQATSQDNRKSIYQATALHQEYIQTSRRVEREREDAEMRLRRLTPQQVKNRQALLNKVRKFWVEGVLETSLHDWVVGQLNSKYQVPKSIGKEWVDKQELLLLLDGLDEVKGEQRDNCVAALNDFHQNYAPEMVVCSRIQDYSALSNRLNLESAIYLKSLTPQQVSHYLDNIHADLTGLRTLMETDTALQELARSPLMLNIMVIAYQGVAVADLPKTEVVEERRQQLFDAYIERMFHRPTRFKVEQQYSEVDTKRWLAWLAQRLVEQSQTVFFIEGMQPTWLQGKGKRILYRIGSFLIDWLSSGLSVGLMVWLSSGLIYGLSVGLIAGLIYGLIDVWLLPEIKTVETLNWSWKGAIQGLKKVWFAGTLGLISALGLGQIPILILVLILVLMPVLSDGIKIANIATKTIPNQGIYRTVWNAGIMGLITGLILGLILGLIAVIYGEKGVLSFGLGIGLILGVIAVTVGSSKACIQHLTLRLILYRNGSIPWNYARFLDYASDRIFLQKVGGGYIFIHRLLLEHFAQRSLEPVRTGKMPVPQKRKNLSI